jgi:uncharacterized protein
MKTRIVLSLVAISLVGMPYVHPASFDCAKAKTKIDKLVCGDPKLSDLDDKLSALYKKVLELSPVPEDSKEQQRDWVKGSRNTCKDAACLEKAYVSRISELEKDLKNPSAKPSLEKALLTLPARPSEERIDATIVKKEPLELTGRVTADHDVAGAKYGISSAKTNYTIRYVWDLTDAQKDILDKIQEANQYVVLKGQLVTYKDGSKDIDPDSIVQIFGQSP